MAEVLGNISFSQYQCFGGGYQTIPMYQRPVSKVNLRETLKSDQRIQSDLCEGFTWTFLDASPIGRAAIIYER